MAYNIQTLYEANAKRWTEAKITRSSEYAHPVAVIEAAKNRYLKVQAMTGVSWVFVACSHYRESNLNFNTQLGQGDPLNRVSIHVPKGRGPFSTFEDGAYDALVNCAPFAARIHDWSLPHMLTVLEMYNGLGYAYKGVPSPYVWSGTDVYHSGKYVSDGVYDPKAVDKQLGVAGLIKSLPDAVQTVSLPVAATVAPLKIIAPAGSPVPSGPILNKAGEDISSHLYDLFHSSWQWLKDN